MMDYYSQYDMPSLDERKKSLKNYANSLNMNCNGLDEIITKIVSETKKYSLTGYSVFGKKEEQDKLNSILNLSVKDKVNCFCLY